MRIAKALPVIGAWTIPALILLSILWRGGKSLDVTWILVGISWVTIVLAWRKKREVTTIPFGVYAVTIGFIVWTALSYVFSSTQNYGLDEVLRTGALGLLMFYAAREVHSEETSFLWKVVYAISYGVIIAGMIGIAVYVFQPVNRFVGTFFDARFHTDYWPNAWAQLVLLAWPITLLWATRAPTFTRSILRFSLLGFVLGCLLLSYSRGAVIAFVGQLGLWSVLFFRQEAFDMRSISWKNFIKRPHVKDLIGLGGLAIAVALITFSIVNGLRSQVHEVESVTDKVTFSSAEGSSSVSERAQFWTQAFTLSLDHPLFGYGPYSFRFVQPELQQGVLATSDHPHNIFLKYAMERGWPAAILFTVILALLLLTTFFRACTKPLPGEVLHERRVRYALFTSVCGVLAHNLIDYNVQFVGIALPFWILLGCLLGLLLQERSIVGPNYIAKWMELSFMSLLLCIAVYESVFLVTSSIARHAEANGNTEIAEEWYSQSTPGFFSRDLELSRALLYVNEDEIQKARESLLRYKTKNAEDARVQKIEAQIAMREREYEEAIAVLEPVYQKLKYNDVHGVRLYISSLRNNRDERKLERLKPEINALVEEYARAIIQNVHFIALSANVEEFLLLINELTEIFPEDEAIYEVWGARVDRNVREERQRLNARAPGFLW